MSIAARIRPRPIRPPRLWNAFIDGLALAFDVVLLGCMRWDEMHDARCPYCEQLVAYCECEFGAPVGRADR